MLQSGYEYMTKIAISIAHLVQIPEAGKPN